MSVLFRPHRSYLEEAMAEVVEVENLEDLIKHLNVKYKFNTRIEIENIAIKPYGYDDRIKWNTHIVTDKGNVIGFTSGPLE